MEYNKLTDLVNTYPQPGNYIPKANDNVTLFGVYDTINKYEFSIEDIEKLKVVDGTTFNFIASIKLAGRPAELYTSKSYYEFLKAAKTEGNPYFINFSFKDIYIVNFSIDSIAYTKFEQMISEEQDVGVKMITNNYIDYDKDTKSASIDYIKLVKYIDWVVSSPKLEEVDTDNVIKPDILGKWELEEIKFDYANQDVLEKNNSTSGTSGTAGTSGGTGGGSVGGGRPKIPLK